MKKFIPIFSIVIVSVCLQNCANRDEDIALDSHQSDEIQKILMKSQDSAKSSEQIIDLDDPPVRDGDNWRINPKK